MSAELSAIEALAVNDLPAWYRLSPTSRAVLFYATPFLKSRFNWVDNTNPFDVVTNNDWDTIESYVDGLLYEVKQPMLGYIIPFVTQNPPSNVLPCDGSSYLRIDYPNLYDVLDPFFITDADNFTVPDLRGRTIIGTGTSMVLTSRNIGDQGGEELHQLDISELATHNHTIPATITTLVVEPGEVTALTPVPIITSDTGSAGGNMAHNNMQPFYALNYGIIAS